MCVYEKSLSSNLQFARQGIVLQLFMQLAVMHTACLSLVAIMLGKALSGLGLLWDSENWLGNIRFQFWVYSLKINFLYLLGVITQQKTLV